MNLFIFIRLVLLSILCYCNISNAQTVFATETFGSGAARGTVANGFIADMGTWTTATTAINGASANEWYVSGEECGNAANTCGTACSGGDNSLHISAIGGFCGTPDCGAAYDETAIGNLTNKRAISPTIDCTAKAGIVLNFNYIAAQGDDGVFVEYSTDNGASWTTFTGGNIAASGCCCLVPGFCTNPADPTPCSDLFSVQGYWTAISLSFPPAADNNATVKFAFHWTNDGDGIGTDPSVAIDDITVTSATILDIELMSFDAEPLGNINMLSWTTLSESNSSHFSIQHSTDGINFNKIGQRESNHNSSSKQDYSFLHNVDKSINYYRLNHLDFDARSTYSEVISTQNTLNEILLFKKQSNYELEGLLDRNGSISVYDLSGKIQFESIHFEHPQSRITINTSILKSGIYFIVVETNKETKTFKIMIQKSPLK